MPFAGAPNGSNFGLGVAFRAGTTEFPELRPCGAGAARRRISRGVAICGRERATLRLSQRPRHGRRRSAEQGNAGSVRAQLPPVRLVAADFTALAAPSRLNPLDNQRAGPAKEKRRQRSSGARRSVVNQNGLEPTPIRLTTTLCIVRCRSSARHLAFTFCPRCRAARLSSQSLAFLSSRQQPGNAAVRAIPIARSTEWERQRAEIGGAHCPPGKTVLMRPEGSFAGSVSSRLNKDWRPQLCGPPMLTALRNSARCRVCSFRRRRRDGKDPSSGSPTLASTGAHVVRERIACCH